MTTSLTTQQQNLPPATPRYVLRGHASPIQALHFFARNTRLISADADGWIIIWDVATKRARAVWKAHEGSVLEVNGYETLSRRMIIYTHGRDHKLRVWRIKSSDDEELLSRVLPVERNQDTSSSSSSSSSSQKTQSAPEPWLLHSLPVNALNFCAFTLCFRTSPPSEKTSVHRNEGIDNEIKLPDDENSSFYFAVPNALNSGAIDIFHLPSERRVSTIPADTSVQTGMVMAIKMLLGNSTQDDLIYMLSGYEDGHVMVHVGRASTEPSKPWTWVKIYASRPHSQPILSLDSVQSEGRESQFPQFFYTSSADALIVKHPIPEMSHSSLLLHATPVSVENTPLKVLNTKHAGQQGLRVRGDQKIFATAGWDARIRVYSCRSVKELAVLKWHTEGCYAVAFAGILSSVSTEDETSEAVVSAGQTDSPLQVVRQQRNQKAQQTHWLAAGSKDGKISLWDIY
ncbi:ASTRA-associated protein 1 [Talaromyces atroroseus]|uniref:ASTRA-associated protein 1 n=1 Tax=Talaromyces atroroseus TaxID=1441469 RepID=A0A225AUJ4_TALAT|nr:ASTRA-associated protein 1 [Talaromyces atroroseus]OKL58085.1 ASTRA-associated protein 1 [Talaromyces atroroseus]